VAANVDMQQENKRNQQSAQEMDNSIAVRNIEKYNRILAHYKIPELATNKQQIKKKTSQHIHALLVKS